MGSRANAVIIENGKRHVYYSHGAAQDLDAIMFWGPDSALAEIRGWRDGREDNPEWDGEWWLDNVWAEGGCCMDLDNRNLILYGGDDAECDVLWLETYLKLLPYTWPGWTIEWSWGELAQIACYAGVKGEKLEQIDCKITSYPSGKFLEEYLGYAFDIPEYLRPGASTLSVTRGGETRAAFLDETSPENLLFIGGLVEEAASRPSSHIITYDSDEFLMGGIHLDYDLREIWLWRTWDNNIDVELPEYWSGWTLHDCRYRYREFYENVPSFIVFVPQAELSYVDKIGKSVCRRAGYGAALETTRQSLERSFEAVRRQYLEENPGPILLPAAKNGVLIGGGNWNFDSQGNIKLCYSMRDHFTSIDGLDSAYGIPLSALEGEEIEAIYALHDGEEWDYDAPIVMRLGSTDVAVDSVSCYKLAIGIERVRTDRTARMLGCDVDPDRSFDDLVGDLQWRIHECTNSVRGARIEQFYWTADSNYCPLALCCRLDNGLHLRIGDFGDETRPSVGDPRDEGFFDEFEPYMFPMQYPKPARDLPVFEDCLKLTGRGFGTRLNKPVESCLRRLHPWQGRAFIGGFDVRAIPSVGSDSEEGRAFLALSGLPDDTAEDFVKGKPIVFLLEKEQAACC